MWLIKGTVLALETKTLSKGGFQSPPARAYEWNCPTVYFTLVTFLLALLRNRLEEFVRLYCHLLTSLAKLKE